MMIEQGSAEEAGAGKRAEAEREREAGNDERKDCTSEARNDECESERGTALKLNEKETRVL